MAEPHVVSALQRTQAGIAADVARLEAELEQRRADLIHVDATLRLVDPAQAPQDGPRKRRPRRGWFDAGELPRLCLERLRDAGGTLSAREIAEALVAAKGLNAGDRATVHLIEKRVDQALRRRPGLVERVAYGPRAVGWRGENQLRWFNVLLVVASTHPSRLISLKKKKVLVVHILYLPPRKTA